MEAECDETEEDSPRCVICKGQLAAGETVNAPGNLLHHRTHTEATSSSETNHSPRSTDNWEWAKSSLNQFRERGISFKLGNLLRKGLTITPRVDQQDVLKIPESADSSSSMENTEQPDDDFMMDFESGIDTWIIDKDDSIGSFSSLDRTGRDGNKEKNMNKENIKKLSSSMSKNSLRSFRIRKRVSYEELSSESESEMNNRLEDEFSKIKRKRHSEPPRVTNYMSSSRKHSSKDLIKDVENLSSEEISLILSDEDRDYYSPGSKRERLLSIENVSSTMDSSSSSSLPHIKSNPKVTSYNFNSIQSEYGKTNKKLFQDVFKRRISTENTSQVIQIHRDSSSFDKRHIRYSKKDSCNFNTHYPIKELNTLLEQVSTEANYDDCVFSTPLNKTQDKLKTFPAIVDNKIMTNDSSNPKHAEKIKESQSLKCNICGYLSAELFIHKSHQIMIHKDKTNLECEYCNYKATQHASLATHIRVHFRKDCPYCDYNCCLKSSLKSHLLRYHQKAYPYSCKTCGYSCETQQKLNDHLQLHGLKKFQCSECFKFYSSKIYLSAHVKKHLVKSKTVKCHKCGRTFSQIRSLKLHMKSHGKLDSFLCSTCNASFSKKLHFENHIKKHPVVLKNFNCEKCGLAFMRKNHLTLHMRVHLPKQTKCKYCSFQCTDAREMINHMCVQLNKLYAVQKRSLSFERKEKDERSNNVKTRTNIKAKLRKVSHKEYDKLAENLTRPEILVSKSENMKKPGNRRPRVLALRENVRHFKTGSKDEMKNAKLSKHSRNPERKRGRPKKQLIEGKSNSHIRNNAIKNGTRKHNSAWKSVNIVKRQRRDVKRIKKYNLFKGLEIAGLLSKQKEFMKELLVEPVAFTNNSFIECYYQSQQPSSTTTFHHHEERHLRRPTLLSCRFCSYKTNSQQLLKFHVDKNHTWDPAVVSKLFRP
ncbi:zinc finger protein 568-like [Macrosteles quadrilineatus]|uniref:zinc finger protein 568-like n=1 Tax=Macrosteles quadrilineatus TaxID=74068 RepID=UPI0023E2EAF8|nr:zinc finger protein 568-like [Macrosteles quadrilineatus]